MSQAGSGMRVRVRGALQGRHGVVFGDVNLREGRVTQSRDGTPQNPGAGGWLDAALQRWTAVPRRRNQASKSLRRVRWGAAHESVHKSTSGVTSHRWIWATSSRRQRMIDMLRHGTSRKVCDAVTKKGCDADEEAYLDAWRGDAAARDAEAARLDDSAVRRDAEEDEGRAKAPREAGQSRARRTARTRRCRASQSARPGAAARGDRHAPLPCPRRPRPPPTRRVDAVAAAAGCTLLSPGSTALLLAGGDVSRDSSRLSTATLESGCAEQRSRPCAPDRTHARRTAIATLVLPVPELRNDRDEREPIPGASTVLPWLALSGASSPLDHALLSPLRPRRAAPPSTAATPTRCSMAWSWIARRQRGGERRRSRSSVASIRIVSPSGRRFQTLCSALVIHSYGTAPPRARARGRPAGGGSSATSKTSVVARIVPGLLIDAMSWIRESALQHSQGSQSYAVERTASLATQRH